MERKGIMSLTEADLAMFEPAKAPQTKPRREPIRQLRPPKEESIQSKNQKAHKVWIQSIAAYAITGIIAFCLFMVVQSGAQYHQALLQQKVLQEQLAVVQQNNVNYKARLERKYSLEVIHDTALNVYHMVPIEGGRVTYLNISRGDQRLD